MNEDRLTEYLIARLQFHAGLLRGSGQPVPARQFQELAEAIREYSGLLDRLTVH